MGNLQSNIAAPLYQQLYDEILSKINSGEYKSGDRILSEEQLSKIYGISRITVRSGIQKLCDDNILVKKHGKGTFVSLPVHAETVSAEGSFTKSCLQMGKTPSTEIISKGLQKVEKKVTKSLGIGEDEKVICIERLRCVDGAAVILEEDYFISQFDFMLSADVEKTPLLETLRGNTGNVAKDFDRMFEIKYAGIKEAGLLDVVVGTPLLLVNEVVLGEQNQVIYFNRQTIRSDIYKFTVRSANR